MLVTEAKAGKPCTRSKPGAGAPTHIAGERLNKKARIGVTHIPSGGAALLVTDAQGSHVTVGWVTPAVAMQYLPSGKRVALAVAERQHTKLLPDVVAKMNALGGEPAVLARQIAADNERFGKIIEEFGVEAD